MAYLADHYKQVFNFYLKKSKLNFIRKILLIKKKERGKCLLSFL